MKRFAEFATTIDLHVIWLAVLIATLSVIAKQLIPETNVWLAAGCVAILPQGIIIIQCSELSRAGRKWGFYLFANELLLLIIAAMVFAFDS